MGKRENENTNCLIRQYFPKGTDFSNVILKEIKFAQDRLNCRPRKVLNLSTPLEEFKKLSGALIARIQQPEFKKIVHHIEKYGIIKASIIGNPKHVMLIKI